MIVIDLAKTDYDKTCYHGCGIGFLDVRNGRIADAGYGWPGSCDYPDTRTCHAGNPPPARFCEIRFDMEASSIHTKLTVRPDEAGGQAVVRSFTDWIDHHIEAETICDIC